VRRCAVDAIQNFAADFGQAARRSGTVPGFSCCRAERPRRQARAGPQLVISHCFFSLFSFESVFFHFILF
jgi:hypothetical protein